MINREDADFIDQIVDTNLETFFDTDLDSVFKDEPLFVNFLDNKKSYMLASLNP